MAGLTRIKSDGIGDDCDLDGEGTLVLDSTNNRVGIGTSSPDEVLEVTSDSFDKGIKISTSDLQDAIGNIHGKLIFEGRNNAGTVYEAAAIKSVCENDIGTRKAGLAFFTAGSTPADLTEKVRIDNTGNVGIGNTSPSSLLHIHDGSGSSS
jgi:hypothetical protein